MLWRGLVPESGVSRLSSAAPCWNLRLRGGVILNKDADVIKEGKQLKMEKNRRKLEKWRERYALKQKEAAPAQRSEAVEQLAKVDTTPLAQELEEALTTARRQLAEERRARAEALHRAASREGDHVGGEGGHVSAAELSSDGDEEGWRLFAAEDEEEKRLLREGWVPTNEELQALMGDVQGLMAKFSEKMERGPVFDPRVGPPDNGGGGGWADNRGLSTNVGNTARAHGLKPNNVRKFTKGAAELRKWIDTTVEEEERERGEVAEQEPHCETNSELLLQDNAKDDYKSLHNAMEKMYEGMAWGSKDKKGARFFARDIVRVERRLAANIQQELDAYRALRRRPTAFNVTGRVETVFTSGFVAGGVFVPAHLLPRPEGWGRQQPVRQGDEVIMDTRAVRGKGDRLGQPRNCTRIATRVELRRSAKVSEQEGGREGEGYEEQGSSGEEEEEEEERGGVDLYDVADKVLR